MNYKQKAGRPTIHPELKNKPVMISLPTILIDRLKQDGLAWFALEEVARYIEEN